nr:MAG TPA: hypothetical protein [Bacteriophage sp.]
MTPLTIFVLEVLLKFQRKSNILINPQELTLFAFQLIAGE